MKFLGIDSRVILSLVLACTASKAHADFSNVCNVRSSALDYILESQISTDSEHYRVGEWTSQIRMGGFPRSLRILRRGPFEDANAFTMATVQNSLAEIYQQHNRDPRILTALSRTQVAFRRYRMNNGGYNFWPKNEADGPNMHLPTSTLTRNWMDGLVAIPADADDTSLVYLSLLMNEEILGPDATLNLGPGVTSVRNYPVERIFERYRDVVRIGIPDFFNNHALYSGAYLTWLKASPIIPFVTSALLPQSAGSRVVLGLNLVDCVVNANVLRTLTRFERTEARGYRNSCEYLTSMARNRRYNQCGVYYPNSYWLHYSTARAFKDGATCLQEAVDLNLQHLLSSQLPTGGWRNAVIENDDILASGLALGSLIKTGDKNNEAHKQAVRRGIEFLMSQTQMSGNNRAHWPGGVFFSGGILVRRQVQWKSDAFTTALITQALFEAQSWFPQEMVCSNR